MLESLTQGQAETNARLDKLETGQAKLEAGQAKLEAGQSKLEAGQSKLEAGQSKLEAGQAKLEARVGELHERFTIYENEYKLDRGALFDGQKLAIEIAQRVEAKVESIETRLDADEVYIRVFDSKLKKVKT
jgi:uncharacterized phage infection (PIP) family protein YhgE